MINFKKLTALLSVPALLAVTASSSSVSAVSSTPDEYHDDWLHVNENAEIVDMYGNPVWLTGCNWFGYNVGSQVFDGVWSQNMHDMLNQIADHGFNLLRVPMSTQILLQWKNNEPDELIKVNPYSNPELTLEGVEGGTIMYSFDIWNKAVEWCRENGIKIMMDVHCATTNAAGHNVSLWYDDNYSTEDWIEALEWFTDYYKDDDTIIAVDLKNEPHGTADTPNLMAKWDESTDPQNWKYAAETAASAVLNINPNLLIMVEGVEVYPKFEEGADWTSQNIDYSRYPYSYYHHTWWGGNFRGVNDYPIDLGEHQDQLVYSPHDYGPLVYEQTWFYEGFTQESLMNDVWYDNWFFIVDKKIAPLLMGEWGGFLDEEHDPDGRNRAWMTALRDLMIENKIHHTFWCFNENSGDTGGLVYDNFGKWDEVKYNFVEPSLWQNDEGKYISLDHQIPLGQSGNGISLSDYYSDSQLPTETSTDTSTETSSSANQKYGDANEDGEVSISDAVCVTAHVVNGTEYPLSETAKSNADVHSRGNGINASDAFAIQQYATGIIEDFNIEGD